MRLDRALAERAIAGLAETMRLDAVRTAWGIHEIVSESMAAATRTHLLEKGRDVRKYALFAFGGSGPVHACRVAENLGIDIVICPLGAGTLSALGLLLAPMAFDFVRTDVSLLADCDLAAAAEFFANAEQQGRKLLRACGVDGADITVSRIAELRYVGQGYEVGLRLPDDVALDADSRKRIEALFAEEYACLYGNADPENKPELVNWRVVVSGPAGDVDLHSHVVDAERDGPPLKGHRSVYFPKGGYREVPVLDRYGLAQGALIEGPAIVEERESTAVIAPGWSGSIDALRNLTVRRSSK